MVTSKVYVYGVSVFGSKMVAGRVDEWMEWTPISHLAPHLLYSARNGEIPVYLYVSSHCRSHAHIHTHPRKRRSAIAAMCQVSSMKCH